MTSAIRRCTECGLETGYTKHSKTGWPACSRCGTAFDRPITIGLDRLSDPTAPGWPSGENIQRQKDAAYESFMRPKR